MVWPIIGKLINQCKFIIFYLIKEKNGMIFSYEAKNSGKFYTIFGREVKNGIYKKNL